MKNKKSRNIVLLISILLLISAIIRIYEASMVPVFGDEKELLDFSRKVSFNYKNPNLPLGDRRVDRSTLPIYFTKFSLAIFGDNKVGLRLIFVIFGMLSLYFIYKLAEESLGSKQGLLALALLTFCQYHIWSSRLMDGEILLSFFTVFALYAFFRALRTNDSKWIYTTAAALGLGYLCRELMILLLPVLLIFLAINKKFRFWLTRKETYFALLLLVALMSPHLLWSIKNNFYNYTSDKVTHLGISLRTIYLYFSELFPLLVRNSKFFVWGDTAGREGAFIFREGGWKLSIDASEEFPPLHWVLGCLIILGFFYCLRNRRKEGDLINFSLLMFAFIFFSTSIIAGSTSGLFASHWWGAMSLYPGVVLCSQALIEFKSRFKSVKFLIYGLVAYFAIHAIYFITLRNYQFVIPVNKLCVEYSALIKVPQNNDEMRESIRKSKWIINKCEDEKIVIGARDMLSQYKECQSLPCKN